MVGNAVPLNGGANILLHRMSAADRAILLPHLSETVVTGRTVLLRPDEPLEAIYFPGAITVSISEPIGDGPDSVEIAVVGREGIIGWPALLGAHASPHLALVRAGSGTLLRLGIEPLRAACRRSPSLHEALLQFVHVMMIQMARAIASHLLYPLDRRVARWLLMRHDRLGGDVLLCQHEEIATCLSARRASITDHLHVIEGERLIRCTRGRVVVRDRGGLEGYAGNAYGHAEDQYRRLIAPFGKSAVAAPLH